MAGGGVAFDREAVEGLCWHLKPPPLPHPLPRGERERTGVTCRLLPRCRGIGHGGGAGGGFCHSVPCAAHTEPPRCCPFGLGARERADRLGEHACLPVGPDWATGAVTGV